MVDIHMRQAQLDDTEAISALFRSHIQTWQRLNADGRVEDVPYGALTIYERWLHGGAWMSVETGAIHLSHLLRGAAVPLVAVVDGRIEAYTELYPGVEPEPFGRNLAMDQPTVHPDYAGADLESAMLKAACEQAEAQHCKRLLVYVTLPEWKTFYERHQLTERAVVQRYMVPARTGQGILQDR